jgi:hypothetical protein
MMASLNSRTSARSSKGVDKEEEEEEEDDDEEEEEEDDDEANPLPLPLPLPLLLPPLPPPVRSTTSLVSLAVVVVRTCALKLINPCIVSPSSSM